MNTVYLLIQVALAAVMGFSSFCRLVYTDHQTIREIRWAFTFQCMVSHVLAAAPFLPYVVPECDWQPLSTPIAVWLLMALAVVAVQLTTAKHWANGVPRAFQEQA